MRDDPSKFLSHRLDCPHDVLQLGALGTGWQSGLAFGRFLGKSVEDEFVVADLAGVTILVLVLFSAAAPAEHTVLVILVPAPAGEGENGLPSEVVSRGVSIGLVALLELESVELAASVGLD